MRLGPLGRARFVEFLPDRSAVPERKAFFLLSHLVRLYVGPELDFDVQVVLRADDVPECQLAAADLGRAWAGTPGSERRSRTDAEDVVFAAREVDDPSERRAGDLVTHGRETFRI